MSLIYGREAAIIDRAITKAEDMRHCPLCEQCDRAIGHCNSGVCALDDDERKPHEECYCECAMCRHSEAPYCTDTDEHKTCKHHLEEAKHDQEED